MTAMPASPSFRDDAKQASLVVVMGSGLGPAGPPE